MDATCEGSFWLRIQQRIRRVLLGQTQQPRPPLDGIDQGLTRPVLEPVPADSPDLVPERFANDERRAAVRAAIEILYQTRYQAPPELARPLPRQETGTRIGVGQAEFSRLQRSWLIFLILAGMYATLALAYVKTQSVADRNDGALALVTATDVVPIHLVARPGSAVAMRGTYWGRVGTGVAVLTLSDLPPTPEGARYRWWVHDAGLWTSIGIVGAGADGSARLIAESSELASLPDAIHVTLELPGDSPTPTGETVLFWPDR